MAKKQNTSKPRAAKRNPGNTPAPLTLWQRYKNGELGNAVKAYCKPDNVRFIAGLFILGISLFLIISLVSNIFTGTADQTGVQNGNLTHAANYGGKIGAYLSNYFMDSCFGMLSLFIPIFTLLVGVKFMGAYRVRLWKWFLNFSIIMIWGSVFLSLITDWLPGKFINYFSFRLGGGHGDYIKHVLTDNLGAMGAWIVAIATAVLYLMYLSSETMSMVRRIMNPQDYIKSKRHKHADGDDGTDDGEAYKTDPELLTEGNDTYDENAALPRPDDDEEDTDDKEEDNAAVSIDLDTDTTGTPAPTGEAGTGDDANKLQIDSPQAPEAAAPNTELAIAAPIVDDKAQGKTVQEVLDMEPFDPRKDLEYYKFPTINLLKHYEDNGPEIDMAEQNANKDRIINVLRNFGVEISSIKATIGPTITLYEVTPAPGVRINKIRNLEDDIALSLSALGIRIIAPIPGKGTIGIERPRNGLRHHETL